ncbi:Cation channel sperm-associated protein subunit epsilon [Geodia barretti]|uniref:Cation channel sperm-associated auxiliary subunit delta n=1 Tax=Geodia barretti TaxID=519541 RepID=A0AA35SST1_GEOBA|nr:Cation channel sperm-associated protein subunit epsilon [Geodia barretti]
MINWKQVFVLFLSIYPLFGECCSCFDTSSRYEALRDGVCDGGAYAGVVLGATCTCFEGTTTENSKTFDCREYSYSESDDIYSAEIVRRVELSSDIRLDVYINQLIKTCEKAEDTLARGVTFQYTGAEPDVMTAENDTEPLICPFNDESTDYLQYGYVCVYRVRITEVFAGNFSVGDVITSSGPDTGTSCSPELGRILQLRTEYLAGVGGPCTPLINWDLLSSYSENDLETLRDLAETRDPEKCGSPPLPGVAAVVSTLNIPLTSAPHCYTWRTGTEFIYNGTRQMTFSVWIEQSSFSDSQREALTHQFYSLGESPQLVTVTPSVELDLTAHGFNTEINVWEFVVEGVENLPVEVVIEVVCSGVLVMGCGVSKIECVYSPHRFSIVTRRLNNSMVSTSTEFNISDSRLTLIQDSAALGTSILLNGGISYISQDDLATLKQFEVVGVNGEISDAAFTSSTLCLLINGEIHYCLETRRLREAVRASKELLSQLYQWGRYEALRDGVCDGGAYAGVVLGATCTCFEGTTTENSKTFDCREYSYSESDDIYSAEIVRRVELSSDIRLDVHINQVIKTCEKAEDTLARGVTFQYTGAEPDVMTAENDTEPLICPFNDESTDYLQYGYVCVYRVRITEVFAGNFSVGDVITSSGPDTGTSCSPELGRILQLRAEYLAGVGGPCTPLINWDLLSSYSENDLETLRDLAETRDPEKYGRGMSGDQLPSYKNVSTLNIPLTSAPHCYTWRTGTEFIYNGTRQMTFSVWIEQSSFSDSQVKYPSEFLSRSFAWLQQRKALTHQFYSLGESPQLVTVTPSVELDITAHGFNTERNVWEFVVEGVENLPVEVVIEVVCSGVLVMGCGVRFSIVTRRLNNSMVSTSTEDSAALGTSILLNGGISYISQDDLATLELFEVVGVNGEISDAAFTGSTLCLLIIGEIHCLPYDDSQIISPSVMSLPGVRRLAGRGIHRTGVCVVSSATHEKYTLPVSIQETYDVVVIWSTSAEMILVSEDGGVSFTELGLPFTPESVHSVNVHPFKRIVSVLTTISGSLAQFVQCDLANQSCSENGPSFAYSGNGGNLSAVFGADRFGDLFIWSSIELYYSPNGGVTVRALPVNVRGEGSGLLSPVEWSNGEAIKQTASGVGGQFALLSSSNRLFYGTLSYGSAIEIASGALPDSPAVISFNSLGQLRIITIENSGIVVHTIPTYSLLMDALYPPPACPFTQWRHSTQQSVFYLDKRETLTLWASVIPAPWKANEISFAVSDPDSIETTSENVELQTAVVGVVQRNQTVTISPARSLISTARTAVKLSAAVQNLACPTSAEMVSMLAMECPPGRHIQVKGLPRRCSSYADYTYTIPKKNYDSTFRDGRSNSDKRVEYNVEMYGCPIAIPYTQRFRPTLELYDDDVYLEEVDADFVVWEIHGRHDYSYTATAKKTYRSCYEGVGEFNGKVKYQILNSSGVSSLEWPEINGMYIFAATVVARDYSFCHLTTHFAVRIYGASGAAILGYILLVMTCLIGIGILVFSYYLYKQRPKMFA